MAAKLDISSPGKFKVTGEQTNMNKEWEQYLKRFDYYVKAANITKDEQKCALLLHISGSEMQDILETFEDQGTTYDDAVTKLSAYFEPKKNISYERHVFHKSKQSAVVHLHQQRFRRIYLSTDKIANRNPWYDKMAVVRLSKLAISCEFTDKNEMIRDQVINSCCSTKLRKKLLEEETLTLDKVKTIARTYELSETHAKRM